LLKRFPILLLGLKTILIFLKVLFDLVELSNFLLEELIVLLKLLNEHGIFLLHSKIDVDDLVFGLRLSHQLLLRKLLNRAER